MKNKFLIFMFISNFFVMSLYSNTINGIILNEKKQPIEFANITLFKTNDSLPISTTLSDSIGVYTFLNLAENNYSIEISYLGYITDTIKNISIKDRIDIINIDNRTDTIIVQDNEIQLKEIQLKLSSTTLNEVQVTATKPIYERKADRIIFNVENSVYSQGSDAMQALSKAPRVQVNNNEINIAGRGNAAVLINDRLVRMTGEELSQYLKSIPSNDIQKIEVILNPSAKYDAEGNAIINIVLKKNKNQGYNGNLVGSFIQAFYPMGKCGINFNLNKKKIGFVTSFEIKGGKDYAEELLKYEYTDEIWKSTAHEYPKTYSFFGKLGIDIKVNNKNDFSILYIGNYNHQKSSENIITNQYDINSAQLVTYFINNAINKNSLNNHSVSLYHSIKIDTTGKKINFIADVFFYNGSKNRNYETTLYDIDDSPISLPLKENTYGLQKSNISSFKIDMEHPVKWGIWNYGIKITYLNVKSNNNQSTLDSTSNIYFVGINKSNYFKYNEWIPAIYTSFNKGFKNWELQIGLRLENTYTKGVLIGTNIQNNKIHFNLFPSLMIEQKIKDNHVINYSINTRVKRATYRQLNPFKYYNNPYTSLEGNPFLSPQLSYILSIDYTFKKNYTFGIYYKYTKNLFGKVTNIDTMSNTNNTIWQDKRKLSDLGFTATVFWNVKDYWNPVLNLDIYYENLHTPFLFKSNILNYWNMYFAFNNTFYFDKRKRFSANADFKFWPSNLRDREMIQAGFYGLDIGIKAQLFNNRLIIVVNGDNILKQKKNKGEITTPEGKLFTYDNYYNDQLVRFSMTYKFGNNKTKFKQKNLNINEEINRVK